MSDAARFAILDLAIIAIIALASGYLRRYRLPRPPVGRFNRSDVVIMSCLLVALPFGYLAAPIQLVSGVFAVMFLGTAQLTLAPVLGGRPAALVGLVLVAATIAAGVTGHQSAVLVLNGVLITIALVGVANLWVQAGMSAGQVVALSGVLVAYDLLATGLSTVTDRFVDLVNGYPFAPLLAVTAGDPPVAAGLGDCLMLVLWPVVAWKAFGRAAAWVGAVVGIALLVAVQVAFLTGVVRTGVPFLMILGPAIAIQYALWRLRYGPERRTREWLGVPDDTVATPSRGSDLVDGLNAARSATAVLPGTWVAIHDGRVVGEGPTPGTARRAARLGGCTSSPVVVQV